MMPVDYGLLCPAIKNITIREMTKNEMERGPGQYYIIGTLADGNEHVLRSGLSAGDALRAVDAYNLAQRRKK